MPAWGKNPCSKHMARKHTGLLGATGLSHARYAGSGLQSHTLAHWDADFATLLSIACSFIKLRKDKWISVTPLMRISPFLVPNSETGSLWKKIT